MATASLYKIAEKAYNILQRGDMQALVDTAIDCYAIVVKREFYENKQDGVGELDGVWLYTFGKSDPLSPIVDVTTDQYYIVIPSSYLRLPCEYGINTVSFLKGQTKPFIRLNAGSVGMWANLKSACLGGHQTYFVEGNKMFFPKMDSLSAGNILLKMAVSLDTVDPEEDLSIPPNVQAMIVDMIVAKYQTKPDVKPETLQ